MVTIQEFLKNVNTGHVVRSSVPMGLGKSLPMLEIADDRLLVTLFFYRSILRPEDKTLLMPPEIIASFEYPNARLVTFETLRLSRRFTGVEFDKPAGLFRHEAIRHLDREAYMAEKERYYEKLNALIAFLGGGEAFTQEDEDELARLFTLLAEPGLYPYYRAASPQFCERFLRK